MGVGDNRPSVGAWGDSTDPWIWTAEATKNELARIRGVLDTVNLEMSQAVKDGKVTGEEWKSWFDGLYTPAHELTTKTSFFGWASNIDSARQQEQAALKWRDTIKERGGKLLAPKDAGRKPNPVSPIPTALLVAGGWLLYKLLKDHRKDRQKEEP